MPTFAIVCCTDDPPLCDRILFESVHQQRGEHDIELVPVLNQGRLWSGAAACNIGVAASRADLIIVAHQDVQLRHPGWFDLLLQQLQQLPPDWAVLSAAGIALRFGRHDIGDWGGGVTAPTLAVGEVWSSPTISYPYWSGAAGPEPVHSGDECLMVLNRRHLHQFDTALDGFHFYGVDYCLQARAAGHGVYAARLPIIHHSEHSRSMVGDHRYWRYLRQLHHKWRHRFPVCLGTHMHWIDDQITSYMGMTLEGEDGREAIRVTGIGIGRVELAPLREHADD